MIAWTCTRDEIETVRKIVRRAAVALPSKDEALSLSMDLEAVHGNGCPLDFDRLLAFDDFNFAHDMQGIRRHLNRQTGELEDCFVPRCAK